MTQESIDNPGAGQPAEGGLDIVLPELKVTQVVKSPEPVIPEIGIIQPYGEYTIVLAKGSDSMQVMDKQGRKIEGLEGSSLMILPWTTYKKKPGGYDEYSDLALDVSSMHNVHAARYRTPDKFPASLQKVVTEYIKVRSRDGNIVSFPDDDWEIDLSKLAQITINTGEGYFIIYQRNNQNFIAFKTRDDQGKEQPPRNWRRYDLADEWAGRCPGDVVSEVWHLRIKEVISVRQSKNGCLLLSFKDRLVVIKPGQKIAEAEFVDKLAGVNGNVCQDPGVTGVIYYCSTDNPRTIIKLDTTKSNGSWATETVDLPQEYRSVENLQLDPSGNFFTFESSGQFVVLSKDDLKEVKRVPNLWCGKLDQQGRIRGIDGMGHLVVYDVNFQEVIQGLEKRKVARLAQGLATDLFKTEAAQAATVETDQLQYLVPVKTDLEAKFDTQLQAITKLDDVSTITEALTRLRTRLQSEGLQPAQIEFITKGIQGSIAGKERILAAPVVAQGLVDLNNKLTGNLTIASISEAKGDLAKLKSLEGLVDDATRARIRILENQFGQQSTELFRREGAVIEKDVTEMVGGVRAELEKMGSMPDFADWQEFRLPQLVSRLGSLANDCPLEASETQKKILAARRQLQELSRDYETRFKEKYAQVREKASEVMVERVELMKTDMDSLVDRLRGRGFKDRSQVESYVRSSEALEALRSEITELAKHNPDAAKELDRELKVRLANVMSEVERGGLTSIAETGQQMVLFGDTFFSKWEGKVQEKVRRHIDLVFIPDEKTKGPGVSADKVLGDIGIMEINSRGKLEKKRLYEGMRDEDEWRYGSVSYRGEYVFPSYISQAEYRKIKQDYADWSKGDGSKIRKTLAQKRGALHGWYKQRQPRGERDTHTDDQWGGKYRELLQDYSKFAADSHVVLLSRVDQLRSAPETEFANGSGYVPQWQSHWTVDETTEHYLEEMAKILKMQLDLQEGILDLKGHAGTGKDVLVKMFANRTNRPYFGFDCSKWTTEFEMSEDVMLEAEDGATQTVKVPSVILNGIETEGAVVYLNEYTAMPEQAQIFLHALTDEKRTLTLKTSSGRAIRAKKSVLLVLSRNPGYPGTFEPQFATKSRMVALQIDYPPLYREKDANDSNPNQPISAAEALRVARQVDSLADLTFEANPKHNEFVKIWDRYVNGIQNGAPDLTPVQRFDVEAILTMVEFAQKLREGFILKFEKRPASEIKGQLIVGQPITGREMRRMAYFLSKMSPEEKATANPEAVTRNLIERFFLSHIDNQKERNEIRTAMATWTSKKRPAA